VHVKTQCRTGPLRGVVQCNSVGRGKRVGQGKSVGQHNSAKCRTGQKCRAGEKCRAGQKCRARQKCRVDNSYFFISFNFIEPTSISSMMMATTS